MAKVKDQVYDGSEESYTDASGLTHYHGEFLRQTITDGYPLESADPSEVVRKSPRGYKPTIQGTGSAKQRSWRDCFKLCAEQWNELPDECPEIGPCPTITSKENIWNAKQAQGVMCSYFDLFMGCCLSSCTEISVTGPDGATFTGGVIPEDTNCWPCDAPCKNSVLSIAYTAQQMLMGETQELIAHDSVYGDEVPCCPTGNLSWEIISGSGTLEPDSGQAVVYEAPESNENCLENPTIQVTDCCGRTATLTLAVSITSSDGSNAINCCGTVTRGAILFCSRYCTYTRTWFDCNDMYVKEATIQDWITDYDPNCYNPPDMMGTSCGYQYDPLPIDIRTEELKASGCCPVNLI